MSLVSCDNMHTGSSIFVAVFIMYIIIQFSLSSVDLKLLNFWFFTLLTSNCGRLMLYSSVWALETPPDVQ